MAELTIVQYADTKVLTLKDDKIYFLDRQLSDPYILVRTEKNTISEYTFKDYLTKTLDYQVVAAASLIEKKKDFYNKIAEILRLQKGKYSGDYWYINTCLEIEGGFFAAPILEEPNLIFCVTSKLPEATIERNNLKVEYTSWKR